MSELETEPLNFKEDTKIPTIEEHEWLVKKCEYSVNGVCYFVLLTWILGNSRLYVWVLFAFSLKNDSSQYKDLITSVNIAIVLCFSVILQGIGGILWAFIGSQTLYEKVLLPMTVFTFIFCTLEAFSYNLIMLSIGSLGVHLFYGGFLPVANAYISNILPRKYSVKWTSYYYIFGVIGYIGGSFLSGILVYFFNYRSVFYFSSVITFLQIFIVLIFVKNKEKSLKKQQLKMIPFYKSFLNNEINNSKLDTINYSLEYNQFPICINSQKEYFASNIILGFNVNIKLPQIPLKQWLLIICIIINSGLLWAIEGMLSRYYSVFIHNRYTNNNNSSFIALTQLAVFSLFAVIPYFVIPITLKDKLDTENINNMSNIYNILSVITIISQIITIIAQSFFTNMYNFDDFSIFYGYLLGAILGITSGSAVMSQIQLFKLIIPTKNSGLLSGIRFLFEQLSKAIAVLIIGYTINNYNDTLWYNGIAFTFIALIIQFLFVIIREKY